MNESLVVSVCCCDLLHQLDLVSAGLYLSSSQSNSVFSNFYSVPTCVVSQSISLSVHLGEVLHQGPAVHLAFVEAWRHDKGCVGSSSRHLLRQPHSCSGCWSDKEETKRESWPLRWPLRSSSSFRFHWACPHLLLLQHIFFLLHPRRHTHRLRASFLLPQRTLDVAAHESCPRTEREGVRKGGGELRDGGARKPTLDSNKIDKQPCLCEQRWRFIEGTCSWMCLCFCLSVCVFVHVRVCVCVVLGGSTEDI